MSTCTPIRGAVLLAVGLSALFAAHPASAQAIGTFRWQQQPYCNVVTLNIVQQGAVYQLDGYDDQCGAGTRASAAGLAFLNPNGSIGFGLTLVTSPGGTPVHIDATIDLASLSGTWRDSGGATGPWTFVVGGNLGGSPRPVPRASFPAGISAGNTTITNVGAPVNASDAANRAYVDGADAAVSAADRAYARGLFATPVNMTAYSAFGTGAVTATSWGCVILDPAASSGIRMDLPLPLGAVPTGMTVKYRDTAPESLQVLLGTIDFPDGGIISDGFLNPILTSSNGSNGNRVQTVTFSSPPPPVSNLRSYYLRVNAPAHTGDLSFCGAQVLYTIP